MYLQVHNIIYLCVLSIPSFGFAWQIYERLIEKVISTPNS